MKSGLKNNERVEKIFLSNQSSDVIVIGGGLAGLSCALILAKAGVEVVLVEKRNYPSHKVCGEYISNEVLPLLNFLGIDPFALGAKAIKRFEFSATSGRKVTADLPLGGFGVSRYTLDEALYKEAQRNGVKFQLREVVEEVSYNNGSFELKMQNGTRLKAKVVIGAFGKRSSLDRKLKRPFFARSSRYMAVKMHYKGDFEEDLVALHNFPGGYCGVSMVENEKINVCYLTTQSYFKKSGSLRALEETFLHKNPFLKLILKSSSPVWERPLTISQIWFQPKTIVFDHILMTGDSAGLIYPLCGNGMAMAIHSGKLAAELVEAFLSGELERAEMEQLYAKIWKKKFSKRLAAGRLFQPFLGNDWASNAAVDILRLHQGFLKTLIKNTHGQIIPVDKIL